MLQKILLLLVGMKRLSNVLSIMLLGLKLMKT